MQNPHLEQQQAPPQVAQQSPPLSTANLQNPGRMTHVSHLIQHLHNTGGNHIPIWAHKSIAGHIIQKYANGGMVIPHPGIPIPMPEPQSQQNNFGNAQAGNQPPPEQIPIDTGNTVQLDPTQFPHPAPGMPGHTPGPTLSPPGFLGPPIRPGAWPAIGGNPPSAPNARSSPLNSARIGNKPNGMAKGGVVKNKDRNIKGKK